MEKSVEKILINPLFSVSLYLWHHNSPMAQYSDYKQSSQSVIIPISSDFTHPETSLNVPSLGWYNTIY